MDVVGRYRRTVSFPDPDPSRPSRPPAAKAYHVRSTSLPCGRSHPLIPQLRDEINELRSSWHQSKPSAVGTNSSWLLDGLARLKSVLDSLDDVLQMPQTHDSLSQSPHLVEKLLEDFLRFVDVFGIFRTSMLALKQELSAAQVAIRRKEDSKLTVCVKSLKKLAKEMAKLILAVRSIDCPAVEISGLDEIPSVIRDAHELTGSVSAALFDGVMRSLGPTRRSMSEFQQGRVESLWGLMRKNNIAVKGDEEMKRTGVLKKMQETEECVSGMENGSERVFRSLISTRVSLLNVLTHA